MFVAPTPQLEPTLYEALDELLTGFNLGERNWRKHMIIQGLDSQGIKGWNTFINMDADDISGMTMTSGGNTVPLPAYPIKTIRRIKELVWKNIEANMPGATLASTYTRDMFHEYVDEINLRKFRNSSENIMSPGIPSLTRPETSSKFVGEKRYEAWNRKIFGEIEPRGPTTKEPYFTDKDYGEMEPGRLLKKEPYFIYSTTDKDKDSLQHTHGEKHGEKSYIIEGSNTERKDDFMVPTNEVHVVLNNETGDPTLLSDNNPILIKGSEHSPGTFTELIIDTHSVISMESMNCGPNKKTPRKPFLHNLSPSYLAALLDNKLSPSYDNDGNHKGYNDGNHRGSIDNKEYKSSFYRWGVADAFGS